MKPLAKSMHVKTLVLLLSIHHITTHINNTNKSMCLLEVHVFSCTFGNGFSYTKNIKISIHIKKYNAIFNEPPLSISKFKHDLSLIILLGKFSTNKCI